MFQRFFFLGPSRRNPLMYEHIIMHLKDSLVIGPSIASIELRNYG